MLGVWEASECKDEHAACTAHCARCAVRTNVENAHDSDTLVAEHEVSEKEEGDNSGASEDPAPLRRQLGREVLRVLRESHSYFQLCACSGLRVS